MSVPYRDRGAPASDIKVRLATAADAAAIAKIHVDSWRDSYAHILDHDYLRKAVQADRIAIWTHRLHEPRESQIVAVAEAKDSIVGFICAYLHHHPQWGTFIDNLHVAPRERSRGVGSLLMTWLGRCLAISTQPEPAYLEVFEANPGAVRFYRRLGGVVKAERPSSFEPARGKKVLVFGWEDFTRLRVREGRHRRI